MAQQPHSLGTDKIGSDSVSRCGCVHVCSAHRQTQEHNTTSTPATRLIMCQLLRQAPKSTGFHCLVTAPQELCPDSGLPHSRTCNLQDSHKQGHRSTNTICTHGTTGPSEPQKAHTLLEGPTCRIPSPRHLLGMTHLSHISQWFRYTQMGGVEVPTKPLKDSCRSYS